MRKARIYYARMDEFWRKEEKLRCLEEFEHIGNIDWHEIKPDSQNTWLSEGLENEFDSFLRIGSKEEKSRSAEHAKVIFSLFSLGIASNRDEWVFSFDKSDLEDKIKRFIGNYNSEVNRLSQELEKIDIDKFINNDPSFVKWTDRLKKTLLQKEILSFDSNKIRNSIYRPFVKKCIYFDSLLNQRRYQQHLIFPIPESETENQTIWLKVGTEISMYALSVNQIPDLMPQGGSQCFPFYTYNEDGTNRRENITDWALEQFQAHYKDSTITKWDIFYYTYAVLHHPH